MAKVNLDALIPREDFETTESISSGKKKETISIEDIKYDSFFFSNIRKPDFQRETNEWDSSKVVELIKSFVLGDLIPAIILWRSAGGYLFVIDGSHRLSSLAAWVNDDYGDGAISKLFYDSVIPDEQKLVAKTTRDLVEKTIGAYSDYQLVRNHPNKVRPDIVNNAKNLAALAIQLQWVEGDAKKAESSFFKINQQAAAIDKTELKLLENRRKPNSIAARAIIRSGTGHKYWSLFSLEVQEEIQALATEINRILFTPPLSTPIRTLDLPMAGKLYSAQTLPLVVEMINIIVALYNDSAISYDNDGQPLDDIEGKATMQVLKRVRKVAYLINGNYPSSLGIHPAIYFYSQDGRHKTASFLAFTDFFVRLSQKNKLNLFIDTREAFEDFVLEYDFLVQQINRKYRTAQASYIYISKFFDRAVDGLKQGYKDENLIEFIQKDNNFQYLTSQKPLNRQGVQGKKFDNDAKSTIFLQEILKNAPRCKICNGFIHRNSVSIDHIKRRADGGTDDVDNGQITHPYCNTGYKS